LIQALNCLEWNIRSAKPNNARSSHDLCDVFPILRGDYFHGLSNFHTLAIARIKLQNVVFVSTDGTAAVMQISTATCLFQEGDISLTVMAMCLIFLQE